MTDKEQLTPEQEKELFNQYVGQLNGTKEPIQLSEENKEDTNPAPEPEKVPENEEKVESKKEEVQSETQPEKETEEDPWETLVAGLPEEAQNKVRELIKDREDLKVREKRARGQVSYYHRASTKARQQLAELEQKLQTSSPNPNRPTNTEKTALPPKLKELAETDPVVFGALNELQEQERREREQLFEQHIRPIHQRAEIDRGLEITHALDTTIPNWRDVLFELNEDGEHVLNEQGQPLYNKYWSQFVQEQPFQVQQALLQPQSVEDAFWAFQQYGNWVNVRYQPQQQNQRAPVTDDTKKADKILQKRHDDLKKSPALTKTVPAAAMQQDPNSEDNQKYLFKEALSWIKTGKSREYK